MVHREHEYATRLAWCGNTGEGTASYTTYGRQYRASASGKPDLVGSADPLFRGDPDKHNPEDLFLIAISSCHMLSYLALCARRGVRVVGYEDEARGQLVLDGAGGGRFTEITLHPRVTVDGSAPQDLALALHEEAHATCFIANSCSVPIHHQATIVVASGDAVGGGGR